ncbi:hypothetical protein BGZ75_003619 [Mortierella antarctica]|nr:hypothetical protein BGZ67_010120 [Mortierella alpina]KAF9984797.1 hypothetical protein BGZ75_003619 [Mortierella antarctica]
MSSYPPEKSPAQQYPPPQQDGQGFAAQSNTNAPAPAAAAPYYTSNNTYNYNNAGQPGMAQVSASGYPGANAGPPAEYMDPTMPRPNDILPLHPAIIQQRQIAATLPPCPRGGYHELRTRNALGFNAGTLLSVICFPVILCCCVKSETVCIKCDEKFDIALPPIQ